MFLSHGPAMQFRFRAVSILEWNVLKQLETSDNLLSASIWYGDWHPIPHAVKQKKFVPVSISKIYISVLLSLTQSYEIKWKFQLIGGKSLSTSDESHSLTTLPLELRGRLPALIKYSSKFRFASSRGWFISDDSAQHLSIEAIEVSLHRCHWSVPVKLLQVELQSRPHALQ